MTTLQEIVEAHRAIGAARQRYRELLRAGIKSNTVKQSEVAKALDVTRETIRRDAMTDKERDEIRRADAARARKARGAPEAGD